MGNTFKTAFLLTLLTLRPQGLMGRDWEES